MADELWFKRKKCTIYYFKGASLVAQMVKNLLQCRRPQFDPWVGKIPWRREWLPTPVFLPGEFHGDRSLVGYSSWGHKELDTTEWLTHTHTHTHRQFQKLSPQMAEAAFSIPRALASEDASWQDSVLFTLTELPEPKVFPQNLPSHTNVSKQQQWLHFMKWETEAPGGHACRRQTTAKWPSSVQTQGCSFRVCSWAPATLPLGDCSEGGKTSTKGAWRKALKQENGRLQTSRKSSKIRNHPQVFMTQYLFLSHWRSPAIWEVIFPLVLMLTRITEDIYAWLIPFFEYQEFQNQSISKLKSIKDLKIQNGWFLLMSISIKWVIITV